MRALVLATLLVCACQPWYRDNERRARAAQDEKRTERELEAARTAHGAGKHARAAEILRDLVLRNPEAPNEIWYDLLTYEVAAGRGDEGRAFVRWRVRQLESGDSGLHHAIVRSLAAEDRIAEAIDEAGITSIEGVRGYSGLEEPLGELLLASQAVTDSPVAALRHLHAWLEAYGEPDHAMLRAEVDRVRDVIWKAAQAPDAPGELVAVRGLAQRARDEMSRGQVGFALALYALAARTMPSAAFAPYRGEMERAAETVGNPDEINAAARELVREGDEAYARRQLGRALRAYRRAVAAAPWWTAARVNLDALVRAAGVQPEVLARVGRNADTDSDGLFDEHDRCPTDIEDRDGFQDDDGCSEPDNDRDGVLDSRDGCDLEVEDLDGFQDDDGCPEPDNDGDSIPDAADRCADVAEDRDGFEDDDGCRDVDNDRDHLLDTADTCPDEAETWNGTSDEDGCADTGIVTRVAGGFVIAQPIAFEAGAALDARAPAILDVLAGALTGNPDIAKVEIRVHTNADDGGEAGLALSQARADTVRGYLVGKGVEGTRLVARGMGDREPLVTCDAKLGCRRKCAAACAKNARVELVFPTP